MRNFNDLFLFVQAVDHGGFAAASRHLRLPKSTVSKRVAELEAALGARLIQRSSRRFALTDAGSAFYDHARAALIEAESAVAAVRSRLERPRGTVRLTASVPTVQLQLARHLPELALAYPELELVVHATDRFVDLIHEGFDIAVRSHFAPLPPSGLVQRVAAVEPVLLVAAAAYLRQRGEPRHPEELPGHDALLTAPAATRWRLAHEAGETVEVAPRPRLVADESSVLLAAASAGLGITCLPASLCASAIAERRLAHLLPGWTAGTVTTTILIPHRRGLLPAVRTVVEFLAERLARKSAAG